MKGDPFWKIYAITNGYQIIVLGTPPNDDDLPLGENDPLSHNCDEMGCPSVGPHIVKRIPVMHAMPELEWARIS
jgi:hypothetical protein